jgi:hypothetical protein
MEPVSPIRVRRARQIGFYKKNLKWYKWLPNHAF